MSTQTKEIGKCLHTHRAHILNLCFGIDEACSLTDITALKPIAKMILTDMGFEEGRKPISSTPKEEDWSDIL